MALSLTILALLYTSNSNATLIESDYLSAGDNLAVKDDAQNLWWLDLTLTESMSLKNVIASEIIQTQGWRLATNNEVENLFSNHFTEYVLTPSRWSVTQGSKLHGEVVDFISLFGFTESTPTQQVSKGLYVNNLDVVSMFGTTNDLSWTDLYGTSNGWNFNAHINIASTYFGWYLVKDIPQLKVLPVINPNTGSATSVPEPNLMLVLLVAILGLYWSKKRA